MKLTLSSAGKRFNRDWIFRKLNYCFEPGSRTVILGSNGSGKSTLLRICSGYFSLSEGSIQYELNNSPADIDQLYSQLAIAAPYQDLPGLFNLEESISFHFKFKRTLEGLSTKDVLELSGLKEHAGKEVRNFSSGMKQRLKLSLAICSDTPLLLLDEPSTNLDASAVEWYNELMERFAGNRTIIVASNHLESEYRFCRELLDLALIKAPQV